jgi:hypothetical protein
LEIVIVLCLMAGVARAGVRRCPVTFYLSAGKPLSVVELTPPREYWQGRYGLQGGVEIPLSPHKTLRLEGAYDEFRFHARDRDEYSSTLYSGPATFAHVMGDLLFSFADHAAAVRPYLLIGLGMQWGNVPRPRTTWYGYEDCGGSDRFDTGESRCIAAQTGFGVSLPFQERLAWFVEGDVSAALLNTQYDFELWTYDNRLPTFARVRFGIQAQ